LREVNKRAREAPDVNEGTQAVDVGPQGVNARAQDVNVKVFVVLDILGQLTSLVRRGEQGSIFFDC